MLDEAAPDFSAIILIMFDEAMLFLGFIITAFAPGLRNFPLVSWLLVYPPAL